MRQNEFLPLRRERVLPQKVGKCCNWTNCLVFQRLGALTDLCFLFFFKQKTNIKSPQCGAGIWNISSVLCMQGFASVLMNTKHLNYSQVRLSVYLYRKRQFWSLERKRQIWPPSSLSSSSLLLSLLKRGCSLIRGVLGLQYFWRAEHEAKSEFCPQSSAESRRDLPALLIELLRRHIQTWATC